MVKPQIILDHLFILTTCTLYVLVQSILFFKAVTLVGMWLIPLYFNIKLKFWRMLTAWVMFSILTGAIVFKSTRKPVAPSTPR